jgi:hypothetical protein
MALLARRGLSGSGRAIPTSNGLRLRWDGWPSDGCACLVLTAEVAERRHKRQPVWSQPSTASTADVDAERPPDYAFEPRAKRRLLALMHIGRAFFHVIVGGRRPASWMLSRNGITAARLTRSRKDVQTQPGAYLRNRTKERAFSCPMLFMPMGCRGKTGYPPLWC